MTIRFLIDECLRDQKLWNAIAQHNQENPQEAIDVIRVGDKGAPRVGTQDSDLVEWAATQGWMILSNDANTLRKEHDNFVNDGNSTSGLLLRRPGFPITDVVECLVLIAHDTSPDEWINRTDFIPF